MADDGSKKLKNLQQELASKQKLLELEGELLTSREKAAALLDHEASVIAANSDVIKNILTNYEEIQNAALKQAIAEEENLAHAEKILAVTRETGGASQAKVLAAERAVEIAKEAVITANEEIAANQEIYETGEAILEQNNRRTGQLQKQRKAIDEATAATESMKSTVENTVGAVTGIGSAWKQTAMGSIFAAAQATSWSEAMSEVGKTVADTLSPMNIAGSLMAGVAQQTMKMVWAVDNAQSEFRKATGAGDAYDDVISDIYEDNKLAGVSFGDAAQAVQGLMGSMAGFGQMGKEAQAEWAGMAATMAEIGVSVEESGALFINATKAMGMNQTQTRALAGEMGGLAKKLGVSLGPLMSEFNASMSDLAQYGDDAVGIFKRLKGASTALGISVGSLVGSMKEMDTIQGAATRAGTLNAVLQGQFLDTHELLNASVEDRILLTRKAIDASGKDWKSMGRAERQMVANAAGFSDMAEAAKFMNTSVNDLEASMNGAGEASGSITDIEDKAAKAQKITEKFSQAMESLAIAAGPIVTALSAVAGVIAAIMDSGFGKWIAIIVGAIGLYVGVLMLASTIQATHNAISAAGGLWKYFQAKATNKLADAQKKQGKAQGKANKSGGGFLKFLKKLAKIAQKNAVGLLALGATFMMIGIGVAIAALGVAQLVLAFSGFSASEILAISVALLVFGATMVGLVWVLAANAKVLAVAGAGLMWFGGAVFVLAAAVTLLAYGFTLMVPYLIQLIPHLSALAKGLTELLPAAGVLTILAAGLISFAVTSGWAMVAFGLFIVAMLSLGVAMQLVGKNSTAFADLMGQIDNLTTDTVGRVYELANAIESVGSSLANISAPNALVFTMLLQEIGYVAEHAPKVTPPVVGNIEKLVGAAAEYSEIKWSFFGLAGMVLDPFISMLKAATGGGVSGGKGGAGGRGGAGGPGGASGAGTTVVLELDGVVLGRTVEAVLNKRQKLRLAVD